MIQHPNELENLINRTFDYRFTTNGVTCFSDYKNLNSILMWSHYSLKHTGVCLAFESEKMNLRAGPVIIEEKLNDGVVVTNPKGPYQVTYTKEYLDGDPLNGTLDQGTFLTTKFDDWRYEKEYRYIAPIGRLYTYDPASITEVIFGLRTPSTTKVGVKNIFDSLGLNVSYKSITMEKNKFAFKTVLEKL